MAGKNTASQHILTTIDAAGAPASKFHVWVMTCAVASGYCLRVCTCGTPIYAPTYRHVLSRFRTHCEYTVPKQ